MPANHALIGFSKLMVVDKGDVSSMNLKLETTFNNLTDDLNLNFSKDLRKNKS